MTGENDNNLSEGCNEEVEKLDDEFVGEDARPVCPKCLKPCNPLQYYCDNCDSDDAINPLTPYIGFVNIRFNYGIFITMWRKIWYGKDTSIIGKLFYLLMIIVFVPVFLIVGLPLLLLYKIPSPRLRKATLMALFAIAVVLLIIFMSYGLSTGLVVVR